jgi:hypothetical protein
MTIENPQPSADSERVPLDAIDISTTPIRAIGIDSDWVARLGESIGRWDPILVTQDLRLIDGRHRFEAAVMHGAADIKVRRVDVTDEGARLERAIAANLSHGLPLSRRDQSRLVDLLLLEVPAWSDRRIAKTAGVCASTVGGHRRRLAGSPVSVPGVQSGHLETRIGLDGKAYPVPRVPAGITDTQPPSESGPGTCARRFVGFIRRALRACLSACLALVGPGRAGRPAGFTTPEDPQRGSSGATPGARRE